MHLFDLVDGLFVVFFFASGCSCLQILHTCDDISLICTTLLFINACLSICRGAVVLRQMHVFVTNLSLANVLLFDLSDGLFVLFFFVVGCSLLHMLHTRIGKYCLCPARCCSSMRVCKFVAALLCFACFANCTRICCDL